ncbi:MAG TPA: DUF308 domain-containing protein [Bradyrhizobium sp.]|nr:DUF308 domain-containing protein [Bradyrhizobium sp.]
MTMLLIAGIAVLAAGLLAVVFGIPVKEFSFGNTLILAGAVAACTGVVMLGLAVVVRELQNIARRLGPANPAELARVKSEPQLPVAAGGQPAPANLDGAEPAGKQSAPASSAAPWQEEVAARDRGRGDGAPEATPPEPAAATKPRRNLLFSSSSRRERERAAQTPDPAAAESVPPPVPPPVAPPAPKEAAPASFEDAWPQSDRARTDALRRTRTPSTFAEPSASAPAPERPAPTVRSEEPAPVTVLKSGVVDGMAYSLYSDGSIEAQMPEGMMRFASIDELRSHLDQRP